MHRPLLITLGLSFAVLAAGCDGPGDPDGGSDAGRDGGAPDAGNDPCEAFVVPSRPDLEACADADPSDPSALALCLYGSGHAGRWSVDDDGLPAYDFEIEQRCDPVGTAWSPRPQPLRDPIHLIGNGRGLVAMAHASGGVEIYSQDRGHAWINHVDAWRDPRDAGYPPQLGGGFSYLVVDGEVRSTRFEDLPVGEALERQTRRFGVGYFETVTRWDDLVVRRRVFAPEADARALVAEVTVENTTGAPLDVGLVEFWDPNLHEIVVELATSDLAGEALHVTEGIDRRRRRLMDQFEHHIAWSATDRAIRVDTEATALPAGVTDRLSPSEQDWFPQPVVLAALDDGVSPDAVWLLADDLWTGTDRAPPAALVDGTVAAREETVGGEGQPVALAMRVPLSIPAGGSITRRFAFGYVPGGGDHAAALSELRAAPDALFTASRDAWRSRMIWAAFEGLEHAGAVQRELAWSSYYAIANATFDEYNGVRLAGQGGSYKYIHGLDGAIGDLALFADALLFVDPALSRDTLVYAMGFQAFSRHPQGAGRYPYATTGVGSFSDVGIYNQRSDAYWLIPTSVARYVAATRDAAFLDREVPFYPHQEGERGSVLDHVTAGLDYATGPLLGFGARGLVAMGTNDYADGILQLSPETTTPMGSSSTFNALFIAQGFPLAASVIEGADPVLAARMTDLATTQTALLESEAWTGSFYRRGFADNGNPLAPDYLFVEPQVLPILAGLVDDARRDALLDLVEASFETPLGAMTTISVGAGGPGSGPDAPQVGGVWPVASAWVTDAWSRRDPARGWSSFERNTLFTHAALYPDLWYGIWSGPDSYNGPDHARAGEADAHIATALTDYPVLNAHVHLGPIRALFGILGIEPTQTELVVRPRIPAARWSVRFPRLWLSYAPDRASGRTFASVPAPITMRVLLPSALRGGPVAVRVAGVGVVSTVEGDDAVFALDANDEGVDWEIVVAP